MSFRDAAGLHHMADSVIPFTVGATLTRADVPGLCAGLSALVQGRDHGVVVCDVSGVGRPSVVTVEALARLRLTARRHGWRLVLDGAGPQLRGLVRLLGLAGELLEVGRESEEREQPGGVEEVVDPGDAPG
ncbi:STAS domain-containing protein [Actinoplanes sp. HUAS TT8]|uniref:STAS domain-containing protein n=1 Tax=Actinoplanes sp. HUAS TT8 TaxID=3447453 RepID=UPI003F524DE4